MHLCSKISKVEWSGYLLYREHGNLITDPENFWIECLEIFPMKKESAGGVEQEPDHHITRHLMKYIKKGEAPPKYGTIHSHHSMGVFFSGTDYRDLETNAKVHNYYLSIVVDNSGRLLGRIGSVVENSIKGVSVTKVRDGSGKLHEIKDDSIINQSVKELIEYKCLMEIESRPLLEEWFINRTDEIIANAAKKPVLRKQTYQGQQVNLFGGKSFDNSYSRSECEKFLAKWIMGVDNWDGNLSKAISQAQNAIDASEAKTKHIKNQFIKELLSSFDTSYMQHFGTLDEDDVMIDVINQCKKSLASYGAKFSDIKNIALKSLDEVLKVEFNGVTK